MNGVAGILSLKRVLESAGQGSGMSRSMVLELKSVRGLGREAARLLLLGHSIPMAMREMIAEGPGEVAMLACLIVAAPKSSAPNVGRSGGAMARTLEKWVKARENRGLEMKVMRFRSLVTSGVLGAVTAMVATLGPLVGSLWGGAGQATDARGLVYGAAAMAAVSSGMLGTFMSGRKFYLNVGVTLAAFGLVSAVASPLSSVPMLGLWGVI